MTCAFTQHSSAIYGVQQRAPSHSTAEITLTAEWKQDGSPGCSAVIFVVKSVFLLNLAAADEQPSAEVL